MSTASSAFVSLKEKISLKEWLKYQNNTQGIASAVSFTTIRDTTSENLIFCTMLVKQKQFSYTVHKYIYINLSMIMELILENCINYTFNSCIWKQTGKASDDPRWNIMELGLF